jgi:hypothetical protein
VSQIVLVDYRFQRVYRIDLELCGNNPGFVAFIVPQDEISDSIVMAKYFQDITGHLVSHGLGEGMLVS